MYSHFFPAFGTGASRAIARWIAQAPRRPTAAAAVVILVAGAGCSDVLGFEEVQFTSDDAGGSSQLDAGACSPITCAAQNAECGMAPDTCGGAISCGSCAAGEMCGGGGPNKCGATACTPKTCASLSAKCGLVSDGCASTLSCGTCAAGSNCVANQCVSAGAGGSDGGGTGGSDAGNPGGGGSGGASASCGDGACNGGEDCANCPGDCGACPPSCGDAACNGGEDCASCPGDCGACAPTEVHVGGGDCNSLQGGLDQAAASGLPLRLTGAFTVNCTVRIPSNVQINGQAATFSFTKAGRIRNKTNGAGGGYTHAGGFVWDGGTFAGAGNGVFTISHSPGFTIKNTVQYAYADAADDGHSIEVNSSGGPHTPDVYTVHITGNTFRGVTGQRANANDEPVQYDFAWDGSGGDSPYDSTMCHNLYIAGNTFHRLDESGTWQFALCAIGGHRGSAGEPAERHNGILIENNQIHGAVGATENVSPNKGAIALWNARDVWIRNNAFHGCTGTRLVSGWDANPDRHLNDSTMNINISGNTHNGAPVTISMPASNTTGG